MRRRYFRKSRRKPRIADHLAPGRGVADYHSVKLRKYDAIDETEEGLFICALWGAIGGFFFSLIVFILDQGLPLDGLDWLAIVLIGLLGGFAFSWPILLILSHIPRRLFQIKNRISFLRIFWFPLILGSLIPILLAFILGEQLIFLEIEFYKFWAIPLIPFSIFFTLGFKRFLMTKKVKEA